MEKRHKRKALSLGNVWGLPGKLFSALERMWIRVLTDRSFPSLGVCSTTLSDEGRDFNEKDSVVGPIWVSFIDIKSRVLPEKKELRIIENFWSLEKNSECFIVRLPLLDTPYKSLPQSSPSKFKLIYFYLGFTPDNFKVLCFQELGVFSWIMSFSDYFKFFLTLWNSGLYKEGWVNKGWNLASVCELRVPFLGSFTE